MNQTAPDRITAIAFVVCVIAVTSYIVLGQDRGRDPGASSSQPRTVIIHLSSGPDDVFTSTQALRMAEEALDRHMKVILFLDRQGIRLAKHDRTDQLRLGDEDPLWFLLDNLARRGLEVIVCGESAYIQSLFPRDFVHYTFIADSPGSILHFVNRNTVVFAY